MDEYEDLWKSELQPPSDEQERKAFVTTERLRIRKAKAVLDSEVANVDNAFERYIKAADSLESNTPSLDEILERVSSNVEKASVILEKGRETLTVIARLQEELDEIEKACMRNKMDDTYKMSYLLDALQGEAKETVKQHEVSGTTYPLVIARLKEKYGNSQALVEQLIRRLQETRAQSYRLEHQDKLWEEMSSIVSQLQLKGENVDNSFLQSQLLGKFAEGVQRHVLRVKENQMSNNAWNTRTLLNCVKEYIRTELQIVNQMRKRQDQHHQRSSIVDRRSIRTERKTPSNSARQSCFYCGKGGHTPKDCTEVVTREQRLMFMRKRDLCLNCGSQDHWAVNCKGGSCRECKQHGHHTSLCPQLPSQKRKFSVTQETKKPPSGPNKFVAKRSTQKSATAPKVNTIVSAPELPQEAVPEATTSVNVHRSMSNVHIQVGQAQVLNPKNHALEPIYVLLDTGADRSFICSELADRLQLQDFESIELNINTFGSKQPLKRTCGVTSLQMWDKSGTLHKIMVTKIDIVTEPMARHSLSQEDKQFLFKNNIDLSITQEITDIKPQVLLGCADLYTFLDQGLSPQVTLPSGLTLIPSRLGYLVSGCSSSRDHAKRLETDSTVCVTSSEVKEEIQSWEDFYQACVISTVTKSTSELLDWTRHNRLPPAKRTMAYVLRFIHQLSLKLNNELRERMERNIPELRHMSSEPYITATENEMALRLLIRHHQKTEFTPVQLKALKQLNVQPDEFGILRCRGRLGNAQMAVDTKYPMLVASKTDLSDAIVKEAHLPYHCSVAQTMANVRQRFWIPKLRQMVKKVVRLCVPCQRINSLPFKYPDMEDLPNRRVQRTRPFEHVGIDYFGPMSAKQGDFPVKVYGIIITCTATRLVHLELVPEMSTEHLLHALRRFFARRGIPASITSDNEPRYDIEALLNAPLLAVGFVLLAAFVSNSLSCQDIDVFSHRHSRCSFSPKGTKRCTLETTEVMKLNSFNQDACIRLLHRRSLQKELRIQWKRLQLKCVKGDSVFTRNTIQRVVDSKRCSHSGSCTNDKCVNISASSLIPELERGNHYPGITRCVESCGGPGCGCFYLSSGCLFYRIFHVPTDTRIYEMFKCPQWREELELEVNLITQQGKTAKSAVTLQPTVPVNLDGMRITLSALSVPPTPALSSTFISDGSNLAIWNSDKNAHLLCESESDAKSLNCSVTTACNCEPAENKVICLCNDVNITKIFSENIENRFPIRRPWITFTASKDDPTTTVAEIPSFTTAELIVHLRDQFDKTVTVRYSGDEEAAVWTEQIRSKTQYAEIGNGAEAMDKAKKTPTVTAAAGNNTTTTTTPAAPLTNTKPTTLPRRPDPPKKPTAPASSSTVPPPKRK
ncbi:unnamed protein product [Nippostrongylus brasiliensis]|uniref:CCHC-type domain-containing protein n=1 Tax=Nippostrongylus brasiliensis TaxID=27835 RepID=A0A0N4YUK2_NIPBR|nr:unnamed protein product [Nippostrongylus brasiliensis]